MCIDIKLKFIDFSGYKKNVNLKGLHSVDWMTKHKIFFFFVTQTVETYKNPKANKEICNLDLGDSSCNYKSSRRRQCY